ncbi:MAG: NAD(P)-dependent oxidoreductase [Sulfobacillus acidophilus]|uniref:NAD(P)-dependent oxidoreductase n=1 Tax=Sulfobacillus acidophilus TaxID=53633 RepID=A0A2T2WHE8_9FIRM|nr:MAG: NAD(P)-dependent oxidoreductase [Sulfobacillus acidophilus]
MRILVSGISGGLGQALAARATTHPNWELVGLARRPQGFEIEMDVTWSERRILQALSGIGPIDALVCLHGADIVSAPMRQAPFLERLQVLYEVDVAGTVKLLRATLPLMKPGAPIVVMGWDQATLGVSGEAGELYALAKGALTSYAKSFAAGHLNQVTVYIVAPGWVMTRWGQSLSPQRRARIASRTRSGHWQTADEVAQVVETLLSLPPTVVTGQVIYVNRGDVMPS